MGRVKYVHPNNKGHFVNKRLLVHIIRQWRRNPDRGRKLVHPDRFQKAAQVLRSTEPPVPPDDCPELAELESYRPPGTSSDPSTPGALMQAKPRKRKPTTPSVTSVTTPSVSTAVTSMVPPKATANTRQGPITNTGGDGEDDDDADDEALWASHQTKRSKAQAAKAAKALKAARALQPAPLLSPANSRRPSSGPGGLTVAVTRDTTGRILSHPSAYVPIPKRPPPSKPSMVIPATQETYNMATDTRQLFADPLQAQPVPQAEAFVCANVQVVGHAQGGKSHQGAPDNGPDDNGPDDNGPDDNGPDDNGPYDNGPDDNGPDDNGPDDNGPDDNGPDDNGPYDNGPGDNGPYDNGSSTSSTPSTPSPALPALPAGCPQVLTEDIHGRFDKNKNPLYNLQPATRVPWTRTDPLYRAAKASPPPVPYLPAHLLSRPSLHMIN